MKHLLVTAAALMLTLSPALARSRVHHALRGTPIVAGQPGILVSPGGEVIARATDRRTRDIIGKAPRRTRAVRARP